MNFSNHSDIFEMDFTIKCAQKFFLDIKQYEHEFDQNEIKLELINVSMISK